MPRRTFLKDHLASLAIWTTCLAALSKSSLKNIPSSFSLPLISSLASLDLVPFSLNMMGLSSDIYSAAVMIDQASTSHLRIPPKMLMKIDLTSGSLFNNLMASTIYSLSALPPTSKKLAGVPPYSLIMSMVDMASPAPLTRHPMFPPMQMQLRSCCAAILSL